MVGEEPKNLTPKNESDRLAAIRRYDILDTPPDGAFDRITAIAARLLDMPIAIISIVDHDRIWFKSHHGIGAAQIGRDPGLCASAILRDAPSIIPDAKRDLHALANPLVAGEFGLRFYAGVPLRTPDGFKLGTLCVIDKEPREVTAAQVDLLEDLASVVMDQLELRLSARSAIASLQQTQEQQTLLLQEMQHRTKNLLAVAAGLVTMSAPSARTPKELARAVQGRMAALAQAQELVRPHVSDTGEVEDRHPTLGALLRTLLSPYAGAKRDKSDERIVLRGPDVPIGDQAAANLALVLHELATNAVKDGALSLATGSIEIVWSLGSGELLLAWTERNGPRLDGPPGSEGFGTRLARQAIVAQLGGQISRDWKSEGLIVHLSVPVERLTK